MIRFLRLFVCLPLLATGACAADGIAGAEPVRGPHPQAVTRVRPAAFASIKLTQQLTDPLYVIDGVPTTDPALLQDLDPRDMETVEVIKHTSEALLACSPDRSVVIITLKRGSVTQRRIEAGYRR